MKRLVPPSLDPLPRSISVKSLALLVVMLLSGVGISVRGYLMSREMPGPVRPASPAVREECTRDERSAPAPNSRRIEAGTTEVRSTGGERWTPPQPRPAVGSSSAAPSAWMPVDEASDAALESRAGVDTQR